MDNSYTCCVYYPHKRYISPFFLYLLAFLTLWLSFLQAYAFLFPWLCILMNHSTMIYRNMENKHTVYFNMCHHYRKILNAKACVDTSPPKIMHSKSSNQRRLSRGSSPFPRNLSNLENLQMGTPVTSRKPISNEPVICQYYYQHHFRNEDKKMDKSFAISAKPFSPTILKTNAQSKLKKSNVYHPPRKKSVMLAVSDKSCIPQVNLNHEKSSSIVEKLSEIKNSNRKSHEVDNNSCSEESSEDSAYNEEEGILSGDSRGSTPQNSTSKQVNHPLTKLTSDPGTSSNNRSTFDNILFIQFLKDITNDILKRNVYTNKALRNVFQYHVFLNKYNLNMDKMMIEISKLQDRLGVPRDEKFDEEDFGLGKNAIAEIKTNFSHEKYVNEDICTSSTSSTSDQLLTNKPGCISDQKVSAQSEEWTDQKIQEEKDVDDDYSENFSDENTHVTENQKETDYDNSTSDDNVEEENEDLSDNNNNDSISEVGEVAENVGDEKEISSNIEESTQKSISNIQSETNSEISDIED